MGEGMARGREEDDVERFLAALPEGSTLLALDLSKRRIGLAGCDAERRLVTPLAVLSRRSKDADRDALRLWVERRAVGGLIAGLPLMADGRMGPAAQAARDWARGFARALDLPLFLQDERHTTAAVDDAIAEGRYPRPKKDAPRDHLAAAVILADFLRRL